MHARLVGCRVDLHTLLELARLRINLRLPEQELHIHPGKLLPSLSGELDQPRQRINYEANQFRTDNHIKELVIAGSYIIGLKSLLSRRSQKEHGSSERTCMMGACPYTSIVE